MEAAEANAPAATTKRPRARKSIAAMPSREKTLDQENTDHDPLSLSQGQQASRPGSLSKKSRSKSFGPGGLDALKETTGNRRKSAALPPPKSILKPTIPLSPLREIPARRAQIESSRRSISPLKSPQSTRKEYSNIPSQISIPITWDRPSQQPSSFPQEPAQGQRHEGDEIEAATANDPERDARQKRKAEIQKQRDARRKSMGTLSALHGSGKALTAVLANRRVSFAPEATLHTWDTEVLQDSTTSSASTDATRRASAFSQFQGFTTTQPETPVETVEDPLVKQSPEPQRRAHQKKRRRSSGIPPMNFNDPEALSSSPCSGSSAIGEEDTGTLAQDVGDEDATTESLEQRDGTLGDGTMQGIEGEAIADGNNNEELDASLQDAAEWAGTRGIETDENGDVSMELAGDDVTAAFKPWVRQSTGISSPHPAKAVPKPIEEKINPFSPAFRQATGSDGSPTPSMPDDDDMSMDMTNAVGGIVQTRAQRNNLQRRTPTNRRRSVVQRRRSSGQGSELGDGTMEFTTALGGLQQKASKQDDQSVLDENEDLSMEFTSVFGGLKSGVGQSTESGQPIVKAVASPGQDSHIHDQENDPDDDDEDGDMDMTTSIGGILPEPTARQRRSEDDSKKMGTATKNGNSPAKEPRSDTQDLNSRLSAASSLSPRRQSVAKPRPSTMPFTVGSPAAIPASRGSRPHYAQPTIASSTPSKVPRTPSHQLTPQPARPITPGKTPPSANVAMRKTSPKKLFQQEIRAAKSPAAGVFQEDNTTGQQTPSVVLAPKSEAQRRTTGHGIDKEGLGSPRMAAILDRRTSLSDIADPFAPSGLSRGVMFDDPRAMDEEVSREREEDQRRESGRFILEQEAHGEEDDKDATANLKEMMQSMTPKKNKLKGRKSLAVGAARGVLGKRPAELDGSDDETSPRTFGTASSPVKRIRLDNPPSFSETTGRSTRSSHPKLTETSGNARPETPSFTRSPGSKQASTPKSHGKFKNVETLASAQEPLPSLGQKDPTDAENVAEEATDDKIGLQDFLNLTNIRFMELTTTKRRPTMAPVRHDTDESAADRKPQQTFEKAVIAGACTIPMLELYQHSCRELKKYISEGRNILRSIEKETLEENPPLFREYLTASPTTRQVMDNQFKNMKTNARLLSKATWYEWRMKLLDGLMESLNETAKGLAQDEDHVSKREEVIKHRLPGIVSEQAALEHEYSDLKSRADELAACDPEDLDAARERLQTVNSDIESRSHNIEAHQESLGDLDEQIAAAQEAKQSAQQVTRDAQKQREECRGWSTAEVRSLQKRVDDLTTQSGWSIAAASSSSLSLSFDKHVQLSFNTEAFLPVATADSPTGLGLTYTGVEPESTIKRFFIQYLRAHLHALPAQSTQASDLLRLVMSGWRCACAIERQKSYLQLQVGATEAHIVSDERVALQTEVLLPAVKTKVRVGFEITVGTGAEAMVHGSVEVAAGVVYGEGYREDRMMDFVRKRILGKVGAALEGTTEQVDAEGAWADAVVELRKGLVRRGAK